MSENSDSLNLTSIRAKLEQAKGAGYWRSLDELTSVEGFKDFLHREFPRQASEWIRRRRPPQLSENHGRVAGARRPFRLHEAADRIHHAVRGSARTARFRANRFSTPPHFRSAASPIRFWSKRTNSAPRRWKEIPSIPPVMGATDVPTQASILGLYDPDRLQTVNYHR